MAVQPNILGKAAQAPYSTPQLTVAVKIGGVVAQGVAASSAAGQVGIMQVTASVPGSPAPSGGTILELSVGSVAAPPIAVWLK